ncbi:MULTISPECIES: hypothetical protein [Pyrococcus]|nr:MULTISPECIES: hypothetical protein [Pyrococcus]
MLVISLLAAGFYMENIGYTRFHVAASSSVSWTEVLEAAYKVYNFAMNLLWQEDPETEYYNGYVVAKTGTIQFGKPP